MLRKRNNKFKREKNPSLQDNTTNEMFKKSTAVSTIEPRAFKALILLKLVLHEVNTSQFDISLLKIKFVLNIDSNSN